jgi:hypothetical protein
MAFRHELRGNRHVYIISNDERNPSSRVGTNILGPRTLVISAHGAEPGRAAQTPTTLPTQFQAERYHYANDAELDDILDLLNDDEDPGAPWEVANGAMVPNYVLTKFQKPKAVGYEECKERLGDRENVDIALVRNRGIGTLYMADLYHSLRIGSTNYTTLYCSFCTVLADNPMFRPETTFAGGERITFD